MLRILVLDDSTVNQKIMAKKLKSAIAFSNGKRVKIEVNMASTPDEAISLMTEMRQAALTRQNTRKKDIIVAILDYDLSNKVATGADVARRLTLLENAESTIPPTIYIGWTEEKTEESIKQVEKIEDFRRNGVTIFLDKPLRADNIIAVFKKHDICIIEKFQPKEKLAPRQRTKSSPPALNRHLVLHQEELVDSIPTLELPAVIHVAQQIKPVKPAFVTTTSTTPTTIMNTPTPLFLERSSKASSTQLQLPPTQKKPPKNIFSNCCCCFYTAKAKKNVAKVHPMEAVIPAIERDTPQG
jgi:CheY-like chemotaxis protein